MSSKQEQKRILVLGGSKFMGRALVEKLVALHHDVTILNRGKEHWGSSNPFGDRVHRLLVNRKDDTAFGNSLKNNGFWDLVVDFMAYTPDQMEVTVQALLSTCGHYVFISTDSVYMVCTEPQGNPARREEHAVRPQTAEQRAIMRKRDEYGDDKLLCEEVLTKYYQSHKFPGTRLPDVLGPYDTTDRHWVYQLLVKVHHKHPLVLDPYSDSRKLSFVFSEDVASAVLAAFEKGSSTFGQAYNIAHVTDILHDILSCQKETPTLVEYLDVIAQCLGTKTPVSHKILSEEKINQDNDTSDDDDYHRNKNNQDSDDDSVASDESVQAYLPSVSMGPVDISKALKELPWTPTPFHEAMKKTVSFFEEAWTKHRDLVPLDDLSSKSVKADIKKEYAQK